MKEELLKAIVVDDESIICEGLKNYFDWAAAGTSLQGAFRTAHQALEYVRSHPVDILVTDINMGGMNGITLVEQVEALGKSVRVVFISAYMEFEYAYQAVKLPCVDDFVLKPIDPEELRRAIEKSVQKIREARTFAVPPLSAQSQAYYKSAAFFPALRNQIAAEVKKAGLDGMRGRVKHMAELLADRDDCVPLFRRWAYDLITQCVEAAEMDGISSADSAEARAAKETLIKAESMSEISDWLCRQLETLTREVQSFLENKFSAICIRAVEIVEREFSNSNFSMQMLADELNVSANYISSRFKREIGVGFSRYLNNLRMERAKKMLAETDKKVFEICRYVGIEDVRYFTRVFKSSVGITPIEFRNLAEVKRVIRAADTAAAESRDLPDDREA